MQYSLRSGEICGHNMNRSVSMRISFLRIHLLYASCTYLRGRSCMGVKAADRSGAAIPDPPSSPGSPETCRDMLSLRFGLVRVFTARSSATLSWDPRPRSSSHASTCLQVLYNIYSTTIQQLFNILFNNYSTTAYLRCVACLETFKQKRIASFLSFNAWCAKTHKLRVVE